MYLLSPNCFFTIVDFKQTYNSVPVIPDQRKGPQFIWGDDHNQFISLFHGLSSAPRLFTNLL